jgi:predicted nucleotidyltransferase component of viral defense system
MNLEDVRRLVIIAMFSDDTLMEQLVLKGGNALALVYGFGGRTSIDVDLSIDGDFEDFEDTRTRIFQSLRKRFVAAGYVLVDEKFEPRPAIQGIRHDKKWGGYIVEFKLIPEARHRELQGDVDAIRRNALVTGPLERKIFRIEFSKYEFCKGKVEAALDDYTVYVYTPEMIAVEKLRAICQQMPEYEQRMNKTARARDFYDIYVLITKAGVDLSSPENMELARNIFAAKNVPLELIERIGKSKEQHKPDWPSVEAAVTGLLEGFDYYFDFVVEKTLALKALWIK